MERRVEAQVLHKQGYSLRRISRDLGMCFRTAKKYASGDHSDARYGPRPARKSKLSAYDSYLASRIEAASPDRIPAVVLCREIRELGYQGGLRAVQYFVASHYRRETNVGPVIRYETLPGEQMQCDWAEIRRGKRRLCAFVATLGYSRMSYVEFTSDEKIETMLSCLESALAFFGGVTKQVLFDNMKTVVLNRDAYGPGKHRYHPALLDLAKHHGFSCRLCKPYRPQTKGKVERFIRYMRNSFYIPLRTTCRQCDISLDKALANARVNEWLRNVANARIHQGLGVTPLSRFSEEELMPYMRYDYPLQRTEDDEEMSTGDSIAPSRLHAIEIKGGHAEVPLQHDLSIYQSLLNA